MVSGAACPLLLYRGLHLHAGSSGQGRAFCIDTVVCVAVFCITILKPVVVEGRLLEGSREGGVYPTDTCFVRVRRHRAANSSRSQY